MTFRTALTVAAVLMTVAPDSRAQGGNDSGYTSPSLATTTDAPWNPASPIESARPWESVLRFPGKVISWPIVQIGHGTERALMWVQENQVEQRAIAAFERRGQWGVDLVPASLGDGTGIGAEFRTTPRFLLKHLSLAISGTTQGYNREQAVISLGPLAAMWQGDWRPRERFYGLGMEAPETAVSAYGIQIQSAQLSMSVGTPMGAATVAAPFPPREDAIVAPRPLKHRTLLRLYAGPREALMTTGRAPERPSIEEVHPAIAAASFGRRIEQIAYGIAFTHDERFGTPHWNNGWRGSVEIERREDPGSLRFRSPTVDAQAFTRITGRIEAGSSFGRDPRTVRLMIKAVDQRLDDAGGVFLVDDLASLGGPELAGFERGRFHDRDLVLAKLSYIYPLLRNLELDLHTETGEVMPDWSSARFAALEQSWGFAFRLRLDEAMLGAVGFDISREAARLRFTLGGVE